ncbi:MAG: DUF2148 domain-containing protein [Bacteroidota bacterium]
MSIIKEENIRKESLQEVARMMMLAARTAPKGRGIDTLNILMVQGDDIIPIAERMKEIGKMQGSEFFIRDAENILTAGIMVLIGTRISTTGLNYCGLCGFENCADKNKKLETPCVYNLLNLGIAIGSAVSVAADHRVDNRIMYSAGLAAVELGIMGEDVKVCMAIPLSCSSKSPFFDRK